MSRPPAKWLYVPCPTCKQDEGYYCVSFTKTGKPRATATPHKARLALVDNKETKHGN